MRKYVLLLDEWQTRTQKHDTEEINVTGKFSFTQFKAGKGQNQADGKRFRQAGQAKQESEVLES